MSYLVFNENQPDYHTQTIKARHSKIKSELQKISTKHEVRGD